MKDGILKKIVEHPEKDIIIRDLVLGKSYKEINDILSRKYGNIDKNLVISAQSLKKFRDEYLDLYLKIQSDAQQMRNHDSPGSVPVLSAVAIEAKTLVENNNHYKAKLEEFIDKEIDLKKMITNLCFIIEDKIQSLYNKSIDNPQNTKIDYILIQYMNNLMTAADKLNTIVNGAPDKVMQQNNINIQIFDQHVHVFQKVIREVIARLDYDTSLLFVDILNEELSKLKPATENTALPIELRLNEAKGVEESFSKLDVPF